MDTKSNELFWSATIEEVENGIVEKDDECKCIICGETFEKGRIYEINSNLYDAKKAALLHIQAKHGSMLQYLLDMNSDFTGLSDMQKKLLSVMSQGLSDKEAAERLGIAQSTVRTHRYKLREKEKQSRLFLAIMDLLSKCTNKNINKLDKGTLCDPHKTATAVDDRYNVSDKEREDIIKSYIDQNGALKNYPTKEKKKIVVLSEIAKNFSEGRIYTEKEVNRILKRIYEDYVTLRRELINYGFIERTNDCASYWVKE